MPVWYHNHRGSENDNVTLTTLCIQYTEHTILNWPYNIESILLLQGKSARHKSDTFEF